MATVKLGKDNFEEVVSGNGTVLVDFWASWCGPCRMFAPVFEEASERYPDMVFGKVDTEEEQQLAEGVVDQLREKGGRRGRPHDALSRRVTIGTPSRLFPS